MDQSLPAGGQTLVWDSGTQRGQGTDSGESRPSPTSDLWLSWVLTPISLQCCPDDGVKVHRRPCNLRTISKLFEQGHYSSVVRGPQAMRGTDGA